MNLKSTNKVLVILDRNSSTIRPILYFKSHIQLTSFHFIFLTSLHWLNNDASNKENWEFLLWEQVKHSMQDLLHHVITVFIDVNFSPHFNFISSNLFMFKLHKYKLSALSKAGQFIYNYSQNSNILF